MDTTESRSFAARLAELLKNERHAMADFLVALAEFDRQRGWIELGHSGLFAFLHRELGLSKSASFSRMTAAGLIHRFPEIVSPLRDGRLCLSTVGALAKILTPGNCAEVLPRFFRLSGLEAKTIVAELAPVQDPPTRTMVTVTPIRTVLPVTATVAAAIERGSPGEPLCLQGTGPAIAPAPPRPPPGATARALEIEPLTPTITRIHMSISPTFLKKLEDARLALSHSLPGADVEAILTAGLDLLLARDAKSKALVEKPRSTLDEAADCSEPGHVPAAVRREVWKRDGGCCQWQVDSGGVCGSRLRIEFDHVIPIALGGTSVIGNVRLLCARHNKLAARQKLGHGLMNRYCRDPRLPLFSGLPGEASGG